MKILLINPPNINHISSVLPEAVEEKRGYNPPLGLLYLAGYIQKCSPKTEIKIIDCLAEELNYQQLEQKIIEFSPDVAGITTMSFTIIDGMETARLIKKINPKTKVVMGGPHVNIYGQETLNLGSVDFIVLGEGEKIFYDLVMNIDDENKLKQIAGLFFFDKNKNLVHTGLPGLIENLDEIPLPARNLINNNNYSSVLGTNKLVTTMMTSRGCPYRCIFCDRPHLGKIFRARSADNVIAEIKDSMKYGIREFLMYDDTFTIDRKRVIDICDKIINQKLDIIWDIRARVNTVDEELLKKLKESGCARIHYGVESGTSKILKVLNKGITLEEVEKAFALTKKAGIETLGYFMIGSPTETREDILQTIEFMKKIDPDYVHITIITPFPATNLYRMALEEKVIKSDVWREFAKNPTLDFKPPIWERELGREELSALLKKAYRSFYRRLKYILKTLKKIKSLDELLRKASAGLKILKI